MDDYLTSDVIIAGDVARGNRARSTCWRGEWRSPYCDWRSYGRTSTRPEFPSRDWAIFSIRFEPAFDPARAALPAIRGDILIEHVAFRYRLDGPEVLQDVSINTRPARWSESFGSSGSGKSTLTKLVQRLYVPERRPRAD